MSAKDELCHEHSGCLARITALEGDNTKQWGKMRDMSGEIKGIMTRLNVILGALLVAVVGVLLNLLIKFV